LENLGFEQFVLPRYQSNTVTAALANSTIQAEEPIRFLREEWGIAINGGIEEALRAAGGPIKPGQSLHGLDVRVKSR